MKHKVYLYTETLSLYFFHGQNAIGWSVQVPGLLFDGSPVLVYFLSIQHVVVCRLHIFSLADPKLWQLWGWGGVKLRP